MNVKLRQLFDLSVSRYILVGALSFSVEISFIYLLIISGVDRILSVAIGFWLGFFLAFTMQKYFAFRNRSAETKKILKQSSLYTVLVIVNYGFTLAFVALLSPRLDIFTSRTIALVISTCWNFVIYKEIIFDKRFK